MKTTSILAATALSIPLLQAQTSSLQDVGGASWKELPAITIYPAREVVTLDPDRPIAKAVAVVGDRILATGDVESLKQRAGEQEFRIDETFADKVIVPGFLAQHDHPVLTALTMASEILAIEDWVLPEKTIPAVKDKDDFMKRLAEAEKALEDPKEPLVTWGYHPAFYGPINREQLNGISKTRPVVVWARSCHEFILNDAALQAAGITREVMNGWSKSQQEQSSFEEGHFWEQGMFAALATNLATIVVTPEKLQAGLEIARDFMHSKGITFGNEPGGILVKPVQDGVNAVFSQPTMPFRWTFMVDGKTLCDKYDDDAQVLEESAKVASWYHGMTSQAPKMVKLFADGAIYSQLMVVREPYLDGHKGEWMTDLEVFQRAFRIYWDAGYQIHIHVNGDAGLDRVLDTLETNLRRNPRFDHRMTVVHFAVSAKDQVERIKRLGAIVSGNPYYVRALADNYSEVGLGPERADQMVRMGDVERLGISFSYHSDMPMAPADPLFLMWCGVTRQTTSGRVAAPDQRVSREAALRAVTLDAAYSLKMENELGSIVTGKLANFTILDDNPVTCDADAIKDIAVWGTVHEGRVLPVAERKDGGETAAASRTTGFASAAPSPHLVLQAAETDGHDHDHASGCCSCRVNRALVAAMFRDPSTPPAR
ncbi:amidohydrolase [Luteolibacter marinus]|uniref:amidohydrolase n=1 Tax=Luteolibacter marinus TaxID=2776705 RepID=UPI001867C844|nr:amidohydrolase [Luteolibacter marinus]